MIDCAVRIATVNAWGGALFTTLGPWLAGCSADILCLQEVTRTPGMRGWTRFDDGERSLPQRANLLADARAALPHHEAIFAVSDSGPVVRDRQVHMQDFGIATMVDERLPVVGIESSFVHGQYVVHSEWATTDRPRNALAVRVVDPANGRAACIVQLHGLRDSRGKQDSPERSEQARRLAELVTRVRRPDDFVAVCGDFNLLLDSGTFEVLAGVGLVDLVGEHDTRTSHYAKPVRSASYMLVSDASAVQRFEIVEQPEVSDHRVLLLEV